MVTRERFQQGMTFQQYLDQMTTNREKFQEALEAVRLTPEDRAVFANRREKLNVLVITEDWCGDALTNFPVLARMVEGAPAVEMRVFLRDQNPDLMNLYLNRGIFKSIPVFVFFDEQMNELARFVERPPAVTEYMEQKQLELRRALRAQHAAEWQRAAADEIRGLLGEGPDGAGGPRRKPRRTASRVSGGRRRVNVAELLERSARRHPERPALLFGDRRYTFAELDRESGRWAAGLARLGLRRGERACLHLGNRPEFVLAYYACQKLGVTPVALNVTYARDELAYVVRDSAAAAILSGPPAAGSLPPASETPSVRIRAGTEEAGAVPLAALPADPPLGACDGDPEDVAAILYTSATTGRPKGVMLTHANVASNALATVRHLRMTPDDRGLCALPLFHCFGQNFIMNALAAAGGALVLQERFVPAEFLAAVARHRITLLYGVPTMYIVLLAGGLEGYDLSSLRLSFSAAAMLPAEVEQRWTAATGLPISQGYGLTECSPFATYNHERAHRPGSVGTPIEHVEVRVVDEEDRPVPDGTLGEIVIRGPNVMKGYLGQPEETARALRGGWLHSRDVGYRDPDGYFYVVDRVKDMINVAGFKVYPREVEEVLFQHPAVAEVAVLGRPDPVKGEVVRACVVLRPGHAATAEELIAACRGRVASYKVPVAVDFLPALPKSPTGKILKKDLR